ncbi:unnamed protein product [Larinioides sclopetarius]|uniref:Uncharacterized protein n=1 Tax=Larinioides sclopetarius TaxID=280406 RepID=A0AAV2AH63_9ARAC
MFNWFKKNKQEKKETEDAEEKSDSKSEENISEGKKIPKVTFSKYIASDDEPTSTKSMVIERHAKQLSNENQDKEEAMETIDEKDEPDLGKKKKAVDRAKRLISEVSKHNIAEYEEKFGRDPPIFSKSFKEIPKVMMSKHVALEDRPEMSKEIIDEHQAKQLVSDVWEEAVKDNGSQSETDIAKKENVIDKARKVISAASKMDGADSKVKFDYKPKTSVQEIPKVAMSKHIVLDDKPKLSKEIIAEKQARQLVSEVGEKATEDQIREESDQEEMRDLKKKEVAIDKAKELISAVSKKDVAYEEEKLREVSSEIDEERMSKKKDVVSKAKLLLSVVSQKEVTGGKTVPPIETTPKQVKSVLEVPEVELSESIESLKVDLEGGTEYDIQDIVNEAGYGKFQKILFFLCGIAWMIANYELMLITMFGDLVACEWTIYGWQNAFLTSVDGVHRCLHRSSHFWHDGG